MATPAAITAAILLIIFHAVSKGLLFLCVGTIEQHIGSRDIESMRGLYKIMPRVAVITLFGIVTMMLPPFGALLAKWIAIEAVSYTHLDVYKRQVQEYIRFNKTWNEKLMTREEAVEDLRAHPVFSLGEQITLFHPESGNLRNWLRGITAFYGRIGELSQEDVANLNAFGFLNDSFLKGLQQ